MTVGALLGARAGRRALMALLLSAGLLLSGCGTEEEPAAGASEQPAEAAPAQDGDDAAARREAQLEHARAVRADETGRVMVLEYHRVGGDPDFAPEWTISAEEFRAELEYLYENDYHPVNLRDFVANRMEVPAGKTPVVLTFDDSSDTQFTLVRRNGEWVPDPGGAVGVLADFHRRHPDWPQRATWFVLPMADPPNNFFGQPELVRRKLHYLVEQGMEIGSHTLYHANLATSTPDQVRGQLARSVTEIQKRLPGYEVDTLSLPFGEYPADESLLHSGTWEGQSYEFQAAVEVAGGPSLPPGAHGFDPWHIPRVQTGPGAGQSRGVFDHFERHPRQRYRSDGNPDTIAFPKARADRLDLDGLRDSGKVFRGY